MYHEKQPKKLAIVDRVTISSEAQQRMNGRDTLPEEPIAVNMDGKGDSSKFNVDACLLASLLGFSFIVGLLYGVLLSKTF